MPEYLAPGVYVEETSFRSKSIEGVGTSTTGFVGLTRKGPVGGTPELLTSFGDFERIYGSLENLHLGGKDTINYLAHAVRGYFNEGGSRLYVSRAFLPLSDSDAGKATADIISNSDVNKQVQFLARTPGDSGNGTIALRQVTTPATRKTMENAPEGTMVRVGGANPALPATIEGGFPPFSLSNNGVLRLSVNGAANVDIIFKGVPAEAVANNPLPDNVTLTPSQSTLQIAVDGIEQSIQLPTVATTRDALVDLINKEMRGGYAGLTPTNELVIGSDRRGTRAIVTVKANAGLGFTADQTVKGSDDSANNNVGDLLSVTVEEINALFIAASIPVRATLSPLTKRLVLSTTAVGQTATLAVRDAEANSVHAAMVLTVIAAGNPPVEGKNGSIVTYYVKRNGNWVKSDNTLLDLSSLKPTEAPAGGADFFSVTVIATDKDGNAITYENMGCDRNHPRFLGAVLEATPTRRTDDLQNLFAIKIGADVTAHELQTGLFPTEGDRVVTLTGGNDGTFPTQKAYEDALAELEKLEDIAIVAAPGYSAYSDFQGIQAALISHAEKRRSYRIAVLDAQPELTVSEVREVRGQIDSKYAAFYYPWIVVSNPLARPGVESIPREITLPPSGHICGIYARNDIERGVFKAPANEVVRSALRFESDINFAQQEVLNPLGINCLRYLAGRGYRVWGARTISSDPEFIYVNVRRYLLYLEASIDRSTQWAVFEPNAERLWTNIRDTISAFLYNEWVSGALLGGSPQEAFFVRCDRSTMTQADIDNGRLICLIGVAVIKPAEFVIFRIGQKTADARS